MHKLSSLIIVAGAMLLSSCTSQTQQPASSDLTLKEAYEGAFKIGAAINGGYAANRNPKATEILTTHFNAISPENDLKPEVVHPKPDVWNFEPGDRYVKYGQEHGLWMLGHTLCWHNQTPDFYWHDANGKTLSKEQLTENLRKHIETVVTHFHVNAWDVVNEIIAEDGSYRDLGWVNAFGGDGDTVVKLAFKFANQYAPEGTEFYYNEFNAWRPSKRDGIVRMVKMLQAEGIRIDGIGIQAHWGLNYPKTEYIQEAIDAYAALGLKVMITELDIDVLPLSREGQVIGRSLHDPIYQQEEWKEYLDPYKDGLPADVEAQLTARYAELMQIFYNNRDKIDRVTFWGLDDGMSWKNGSPIPGRTNYSLLWNRGLTPKPALDAIIAIPNKNK